MKYLSVLLAYEKYLPVLTPSEVDGLLADSDPGLAAAVSRLIREDGLLERLTAHNRATPPAAGWRDVLAAAEREYARARRLLPF